MRCILVLLIGILCFSIFETTIIDTKAVSNLENPIGIKSSRKTPESAKDLTANNSGLHEIPNIDTNAFFGNIILPTILHS